MLEPQYLPWDKLSSICHIFEKWVNTKENEFTCEMITAKYFIFTIGQMQTLDLARETTKTMTQTQQAHSLMGEPNWQVGNHSHVPGDLIKYTESSCLHPRVRRLSNRQPLAWACRMKWTRVRGMAFQTEGTVCTRHKGQDKIGTPDWLQVVHSILGKWSAGVIGRSHRDCLSWFACSAWV